MALERYYTGLSDIDLAKDAIAKKPDLYIQKYEYIGSGVYAIPTGGTSTLTPAVSPAWTIDDYASTVATNLIAYDDNSKAVAGKVVSNDADSITFDETALLLEEDGTTAATLTVGNTYDFYVLTPSSTTGNTYGPFFGYTEGSELNLNDTYMKFKYGVPKQLKFKDLEEREGQITGGHIGIANDDVLETLFQAELYGLQTAQVSYGVGSDPDTDKFYRLTFTNKTRDDRSVIVIARKCQFELTGNIFQDNESGYRMAPFTADLTADGFYPETVDMLQIIRSDT